MSSVANKQKLVEAKHTPEPYIVVRSHRGVPHIICTGSTGGLIARCDTNKSEAENQANARRMVAAVNACRGIPTDDLEYAGGRSDRLEWLTKVITKAESTPESIEGAGSFASTGLADEEADRLITLRRPDRFEQL